MRAEAAKRLLDAYRACRAIDSFTAGLDFAAFGASALIRSAVERQFEIVGEAPGRAIKDEPSLADSMPDIPRIVGLRNRLIHDYDSVDDQLVWDLVRHKLPTLSAALAQSLTNAGYGGKL